jgi:hypothetical protein
MTAPRILAVLAVVAATCGPERATKPATSTQATAAQTTTATPAPRSVEPSPAVKALLADDPDLDARMSEDEVRATLEAARNAAPPPPPPERSRSGDSAREAASSGGDAGEWGRLEKQQKARLDAYRERLESTIVHASRDGSYHAGGCERLYDYVMLQDQTLRRVYAGRQITLAGAVAAGLPRHAACGAPSAEFSYR